MVLTWEAKVIAAEDADADAETNRKHKITPDWGDLIKKGAKINLWTPIWKS